MSAERYIMAYLKQFDPLEADASALELRWDYKTQTGKALTDIAAAISVPRLGLSDEELRRRIDAQIAINACTGTVDHLLPAIKLMTQADRVRVILHTHGTFDVELTGSSIDLWGVSSLGSLPAAGCAIESVRIYDANTFTLDDDNLGLDNGELL